LQADLDLWIRRIITKAASRTLALQQNADADLRAMPIAKEKMIAA
jgi:hypothetical protein